MGVREDAETKNIMPNPLARLWSSLNLGLHFSVCVNYFKSFFSITNQRMLPGGGGFLGGFNADVLNAQVSCLVVPVH